MSRYCNRSGELGQGCCLATHPPNPLPLSREGGAARGHCVQQTSWREKLSGLARRLVPKTSASAASRRCRNLWFLPGLRGCPPPHQDFPLSRRERGIKGVRLINNLSASSFRLSRRFPSWYNPWAMSKLVEKLKRQGRG